MFDVLRFWMERGVDGFRIDVAARVMRDPLLRDNPPARTIDPTTYKFNAEWAATEHIYDAPHHDIHHLFRRLREVLNEYPERFSVGEIHEFNWERWAAYYGHDDELHMPFNFAMLKARIDPGAIRNLIKDMEAALPAAAWPNWVAGNHDEPRIATKLGSSESRAMAVLLLTLRGTPTLYYGDELGMVQTDIPADQQKDPWGRRVEKEGRDGCRTPMQWNSKPNAGFSAAGVETWLPVHPNHATINVEAELGDPASHLELYRRLLRLRRAEPALFGGEVDVLPGPGEALTYRRSHPAGRDLVVVANLSGGPVAHGARGEIVLGTNHEREGRSFTGDLAPWETVVLSDWS
jgi:glycosidase